MLRKFAAAATMMAMLAAPATQAEDRAMTKGEERLAKMLEGRVAGEARRCIPTSPSRSLTVIDDTALVYKRGDTVWVNYTRNPESLDDSDYLVIRKFGGGSQLCRHDNVTTRDRGSNFFSGVIFLDDFVPYRRAEG